MKLDNIYDVLKKNISKGCSVHYLGSCIENSKSCSKIYEDCKSYDEFEKRVLNKECETLEGRYFTYYYDGFVAFVEY